RPGARRPGGRRLRIAFAGFSPEARSMAAMLDPRVLRLSRSPNPKGEWHSGELETALVLARRPDLVRRAIARRLPPVWVDFRAALRKGAKRFEEIAPGGLGYFGWPAAARAVTARRALALRGRLMAAEIIRVLGPRRPRSGPIPASIRARVTPTGTRSSPRSAHRATSHPGARRSP
ncbi:MAG TPA: hypothetical protein VKJ67_15705, partial [Methylomirabilota bacterium]|nr:hypothetical protein [Methylomirabilota bacterium]